MACPVNITSILGHCFRGQGVKSADYGEEVARFWAKVSTTPTERGCWLWTASCFTNGGHGQFRVKRADGQPTSITAHRFMWELAIGPIPEGLNVLHECDNPPCVNPEHLFLGSQADNLTDARRKGRLIDGLAARKLSDEAYRDILATAGERGSGVRMAHKYGISDVSVSRIRCGRQGLIFHRGHRIEAPLEPESATTKDSLSADNGPTQAAQFVSR